MRKYSKLVLVISIIIMILCVSMMACTDDGGKSAYEIAVEHGFIGTEEEWLNSLVGKPGADGLNGANGINGANGADGKDAQTITPETLYVMYQDAVNKDGYKGSYVEFLKKLNIDVSGVIASTDSTAVVNYAARSIVRVFAHNAPGQEAGSAGSGVIYKLYKEQGHAYIITNYHVVYNKGIGLSNNIEVMLYGSEDTVEQRIPAILLGGSEYYDIAVIEVRNSERLKNSNAIAAQVEENVALAGSNAIAIGNAKNKGISVSKGVVSMERDIIEITTKTGKTITDMKVIRIDTVINNGNSGGGLFNTKGQLIGIVNAKSGNMVVDGMSYSLPMDVVKSIADNIIEKCDGNLNTLVKSVNMGVVLEIADSYLIPIDENGNKVDLNNLPSGTKVFFKEHKVLKVKDFLNKDQYGIRVMERAGILAGDIILKAEYNNKSVDMDIITSLDKICLDTRKGNEIKFTVSRNGEEKVLTTTIVDEDIVNTDNFNFNK